MVAMILTLLLNSLQLIIKTLLDKLLKVHRSIVITSVVSDPVPVDVTSAVSFKFSLCSYLENHSYLNQRYPVDMPFIQ